MSDTTQSASSEFVVLLTKHQADLHAFLISLLPGDPEVDDILQKTNLVIYNKRDGFEPGTNFLAWAFTVARFEALTHMKARKRQRVVLLDQGLLEVIAVEAPEVFVCGNRRLEALEVCLAKLRPKDRALLDHRYRSGAGLKVYARSVGRTASSLSVTLNRLRAALRKCVNAHLATVGGGE